MPRDDDERDPQLHPGELAQRSEQKRTEHEERMWERLRAAAETGHDPGAAADVSARRNWETIQRGLRR